MKRQSNPGPPPIPKKSPAPPAPPLSKILVKPEWWPENPYPESIFPMTIEDYVNVIPAERLRTAISSCLGRLFWEIASSQIYDAVRKNTGIS